MLKIWGRKNSANVKKALWCAEEIGLAYESVEVGGPFGGLDSPGFRALNPNGLIPVSRTRGRMGRRSCSGRATPWCAICRRATPPGTSIPSTPSSAPWATSGWTEPWA